MFVSKEMLESMKFCDRNHHMIAEVFPNGAEPTFENLRYANEMGMSTDYFFDCVRNAGYSILGKDVLNMDQRKKLSIACGNLHDEIRAADRIAIKEADEYMFNNATTFNLPGAENTFKRMLNAALPILQVIAQMAKEKDV